MNLYGSVGQIKGVGTKKLAALKKMNIHTVEDLIFNYPRDYQDLSKVTQISKLEMNCSTLIKAKVDLIIKGNTGYKKKQTLKILVSDDTGVLEIVFFNAKYIMDYFRVNEEYDFYGKITDEYGKIKMSHPEYFKSLGNESLGILPVYSLTFGISQSEIRKWQKECIWLVTEIEDYLPKEVINRNRLCDLQYALMNIHQPKDGIKLREAKYRLIFDELFCLQAGLLSIKLRDLSETRSIVYSKDIKFQDYIKTLSFKLTEAQYKVLEEINQDMESMKPMNRLIQGDVGSGKTVVAEATIYKAVKSGYQAALMAPTEILAKQHYQGLKRNFEPHGIRVGFLSGSMKVKERRETLHALEKGLIHVLVGTHAIIQTGVEFNKLGLVITDEQHRFGVHQRISLASKGENVDIMVMTATPIPRTLAVIIYGDLDISIIDQMPPGRKEIITRGTDSKGRNLAYEFLEKEIEKGRQAYVVTPLIEESQSLNAVSTEEVFDELKNRWGNKKIEVLHGDMKQADKNRIMEEFYQGTIQILVATVVIEVGINVPNASVMLIENAERFGLAQLHQLRGRVGRGEDQSYCLLINNGKTEISMQRENIMVSSSDGFYIAEKDLELRGPGEFFGTRQHGLPDLKIADLIKHIKILNLVREEAKLVLKNDPFLTDNDNEKLRIKVEKMFNSEEDFSLSL
ncbi:MAG: ATP-dependent DNA helicase RecG [Peptostreptococcaceae bacterium]|nr:ATP-dependent DNA helicase RecG [Peptostreptococcaceae bacterium]